MKRYIKANYSNNERLSYYFNYDSYPDTSEHATIASYICSQGTAYLFKDSPNRYCVNIDCYNDQDKWYIDMFTKEQLDVAVARFNFYIKKFFNATKELSEQSVLDVAESYETPTEVKRKLSEILDEIDEFYYALESANISSEYTEEQPYDNYSYVYVVDFNKNDISNNPRLTEMYDELVKFLNSNKGNLSERKYHIINKSNGNMVSIGVGK